MKWMTVCANMTENKLNYLLCIFRGHIFRLMPDRSICKASEEDIEKANYIIWRYMV